MFTIEDALIEMCRKSGGRIRFQFDYPVISHDLPEISRGFEVHEMYVKDSVLKDKERELCVYGRYTDSGLNDDRFVLRGEQPMWDIFDTMDESYVKSLGALVDLIEPRSWSPDPLERNLLEANALKRLASDCSEPIMENGRPTGMYWDKALDFDIPGWTEFKGLRFKDFETSKAVKVRLNDGSTHDFSEFPDSLQSVFHNGLKRITAKVESIYDRIHKAYGDASISDEEVTGRFAEDFAGKVKWSRGIDFDVEGMPEFRGLRYINFKDCTNVHVLNKDGESVPLSDVPIRQLEKVFKALESNLRQVADRNSKVDKIFVVGEALKRPKPKGKKL